MPESLIDHLASHDVKCPMCGYNLRNNPNGTCSECGLDLASIPLTRLEMIYKDAKFERGVLRLAIFCILVIATPFALGVMMIGSIKMIIVGVAMFTTVALVCYKVDSGTHRRHIKKSMSTFYDGTTPFGTLSFLIITVLLFPAIMLFLGFVRYVFTYMI